MARYGFSLLFQGVTLTFPWGTFAANVAGCFIIGVVMKLAGATDWVSPEARLLLATGLCGGFTTMSSFIYELTRMARDGEWLFTAIYLNATFFGCVLTYFLGTWGTQLTFNLKT